MRVFALSTGLLVRELRGHVGAVQSLALAGSVLVSGGSDDMTIKVWSLLQDVDASECATLDKHSTYVRSVAISPSGGFVASVTNGIGGILNADQGKLFVWRPANTKKAR